MTQKQALHLLKTVEQEAPQIQASIDASHPGKDGRGHRVRFELNRRVLYANQPGDWQEIKHAWQYFFLPEEQWDNPTIDEHAHYLVDGIPMIIRQDKAGYWRATYKRDGRIRKMYWGKDDPRGRYPRLSEKEAV